MTLHGELQVNLRLISGFLSLSKNGLRSVFMPLIIYYL
jgi:hypothetical protein